MVTILNPHNSIYYILVVKRIQKVNVKTSRKKSRLCSNFWL